MGNNEAVGLDVVLKICTLLNCPIYDVVEVVETMEPASN